MPVWSDSNPAMIALLGIQSRATKHTSLGQWLLSASRTFRLWVQAVLANKISKKFGISNWKMCFQEKYHNISICSCVQNCSCWTFWQKKGSSHWTQARSPRAAWRSKRLSEGGSTLKKIWILFPFQDLLLRPRVWSIDIYIYSMHNVIVFWCFLMFFWCFLMFFAEKRWWTQTQKLQKSARSAGGNLQNWWSKCKRRRRPC